MSVSRQRPAVAAVATRSYRVVGTRPVRPDGADKVTGRAIFGVDVKLPGMLCGMVLRSPYAHARIKAIDTSRAEALPGVRAVITARDIWPAGEKPGDAPIAAKLQRDWYLASDKVLYRGHAVAAVAAMDRFVAEEALALIDVEYEELPPVLDVLQAMEESSPLLHEKLQTQSLGKPTGKPSNVATHLRVVKGDPEKGFAEAEIVVEREFRTSRVHQGYLESHVATASWSPEGTVTIWASTQGAFVVRADVARLLRLPLSRVKVIPAEVGGAFGGKNVNYLDPLAALLSRRSGRPVRIAMSRPETFDVAGPTPASVIRVKMGATRAGRITAVTARVIFEAGAFPGSAIGGAVRCMFTPYDIPHGQIDAYDVLTNKCRVAAYRAPGATHGAFAVENVVDEICEQIRMDPLEFRLLNAGHEGTERMDGVRLGPVAFAEVIKAAMAHEHYRAPLGGPNRGRGVACGWWSNNGAPSTAAVGINLDGTVNLVTGSVDLQGTRTSIAMQVAETLGLGLEQVHPSTGDTDSIGFTNNSGGSRTTFATGLAGIQAARAALKQMEGRAALTWGVDAATVSYASGVFTTSADPTKRITFREVAARTLETGGPIFASAGVNSSAFGSALGVHIVDVEVSPRTGQTRILRYTELQDVGQAVHPALVEGQIHGGVAQGIGWALFEGYSYDERGAMLNRSFLDYKMPTSLDLPPIDTVLVEDVPNPGHPYGVRGVAETPIVGPPAVVAIAVHRATGVRMRELPIAAPRLLKAMGVID